MDPQAANGLLNRLPRDDSGVGNQYWTLTVMSTPRLGGIALATAFFVPIAGLFFLDNTRMLYGDGQEVAAKLIAEVKQL